MQECEPSARAEKGDFYSCSTQYQLRVGEAFILGFLLGISF